MLIASVSEAQLAALDSVYIFAPYLNDTIHQLNKRNEHFVDRQGNFWIGFSCLGARRLTDTLWTPFNTTNSGIASNFVLDISQASNNEMWFGTNAGVSVYSNNNWTNYNKANSGVCSDTITVIGHYNTIHWIGTRNGLSKFDGSTFTSYNAANSGLPADSIMSLATENTGNVWVGTKFGLAYFNGSQWTTYDSLHNNFGAKTIYDIEITDTGTVWIATGNSVYYLSNGVFIDFYEKIYKNACTQDYGNLGIYYLSSNGASVYFVPTFGGLVKANENDTILNVCTYSVIPFGNVKTLIRGAKMYLMSESPRFLSNAYDIFFMVCDFASSEFSTIQAAKPFQQYDHGIYGFIPPYSAPMAPLNVNQIYTQVLNKGDLHWDPVSSVPYYAVPVCSRRGTVFASALWLGGIDQSGLLHTAAQTYRQQGSNDFYSGPLDTTNAQTNSATQEEYNKLWKVDEWVINEFRLNYLNGNVANGTYTIPKVILKWPAEGSGTHPRYLAPFVDYDSDGKYNAYHGDYPLINGDQMVWWIFNDQGAHTETSGAPFGFEIQGKAYGYGCPYLSGIDTVFNYTTFYQWKIINRSTQTYHNMYVGLWCDFDLGDPTDDYIGSDVANSTFFAYNGDANDNVNSGGYGTNPPIQNITVLKGPLAIENDGIDNNHNNVIDEWNETLDMTNFIHYGNSLGSPNTSPSTAGDYYDYMMSIWTDGTHLKYGGNGVLGTTDCEYMFPGTTDPAFPTQNWTMVTAGIGPNDRNGLGSCGPFTIAPGEIRTIDFAYITTREPNQQISIATNQLYTSYIRNWFSNGAHHPCPHDSFTFALPSTDTSTVILYPNPAIDFFFINYPQGASNQKIIVFDMQGRLCIDKIRDGNRLDISKLMAGIYFLKLVTYDRTVVARFVKADR